MSAPAVKTKVRRVVTRSPCQRMAQRGVLLSVITAMGRMQTFCAIQPLPVGLASLPARRSAPFSVNGNATSTFPLRPASAHKGCRSLSDFAQRLLNLPEAVREQQRDGQLGPLKIITAPFDV